MSQNAPNVTGNPTGLKPLVTRFPQDASIPCKYHDGYVATSTFDYQNHLTAYHSEGGPREDPSGRYVGQAGERFHTLPERLARFVNSRQDTFTSRRSGETFTSEAALRLHESARAHKVYPQTMKPVTGDKSQGALGGNR